MPRGQSTASIKSHLPWKIAATKEEVRKAIANQFISTSRRDFVDTAKGKHVHFLSGPMLCPGVAVGNSIDAVSFLKELTIQTQKEAI